MQWVLFDNPVPEVALEDAALAPGAKVRWRALLGAKVFYEGSEAEPVKVYAHLSDGDDVGYSRRWLLVRLVNEPFIGWVPSGQVLTNGTTFAQPVPESALQSARILPDVNVRWRALIQGNKPLYHTERPEPAKVYGWSTGEEYGGSTKWFLVRLTKKRALGWVHSKMLLMQVRNGPTQHWGVPGGHVPRWGKFGADLDDGYTGGQKPFHVGLDIVQQPDTTVYALGTGTVLDTGHGDEGWRALIRYADYLVWHHHLRDLRVDTGGQVSKGTMIGKIARKHEADYGPIPHTHLQVWRPSHESEARKVPFSRVGVVDPWPLRSGC